jgi:hypothetical protein
LVPVQRTSTKIVPPSTADRRSLCAKVRDRAEQRRPIRAHLVDSLESAWRMQRLLAAVVLVEAGKHAFEVVRVLRSRQPVDHGPRVCHRASVCRNAGGGNGRARASCLSVRNVP